MPPAPDPHDPVGLAQALIRCPSVTPAEAGALDLLENVLTALGFECTRLVFEAPSSPPVDNLFASYGKGAPHFCFAGHSDVVPIGDREAWSNDPFAGEIRDGLLLGRGAADMKGAIAAFIAAAADHLRDGEAPANGTGSISLMITGDEEGPAVNGTVKILEWLKAENAVPDVCLVGEPTNPSALGESVKIGRRGSLVGRLEVRGIQGHTAYPHLADNPVHRLIGMLSSVIRTPLDCGNDYFQPSDLQVTTIDVGNLTTNVIPAVARAVFNIRFNNKHTSEQVITWLHEQFAADGGDYHLDVSVSGEAFLSPPGPFSEMVVKAVEGITGNRPELNTAGGTSDARFIRLYCPVAEFGMIGQTMHKIDECARVEDIETLKRVYRAILQSYFSPSDPAP